MFRPIYKPDKLRTFYLYGLSLNINQSVVDLLIQNPEYIYWHTFSENSNNSAVEFLLHNQHKIEWMCFSKNSNPHAFTLLSKINIILILICYPRIQIHLQ